MCLCGDLFCNYMWLVEIRNLMLFLGLVIGFFEMF